MLAETIQKHTMVQVVTCIIGERWYAVPLTNALQVIRLPDLVPIVGASQQIAGLLNLHGQLIPVIDSHCLIGLPSHYTLESMIILVGIDDTPAFGLLVDLVTGVGHYSADYFTPILYGANYLAGALQDSTGTILLFDPVALGALI